MWSSTWDAVFISEYGAARRRSRRRTVQQRFPWLAARILSGELDASRLVRDRSMMLSGGADGADTAWGEYALEAGYEVVHFAGRMNSLSDEVKRRQKHCVFRVPDKVLMHPAVTAALARAGEALLPDEDRAGDWQADWIESRRNLLQVCRADAVYAVGDREGSARMNIRGGTGFAARFYLDRFEHDGEDPSQCELYFYDENVKGDAYPRTRRKWSRWDVESETWTPLRGLPPRPVGLWTGIGASSMGDVGRRQIAKLLLQP